MVSKCLRLKRAHERDGDIWSCNFSWAQGLVTLILHRHPLKNVTTLAAADSVVAVVVVVVVVVVVIVVVVVL